jgi:phosphate transport system protein
MSKHMTRDLEELEKRLLLLASRVEDSVKKAIEALVGNRSSLAEEVIKGDLEIDRLEVEIEEDCLKILALHQPVAQDLRQVAACLKIDNDLERIGDLAVNIAERALAATRDSSTFPAPLRDMVDVAARMLHDAIEAFVRADAESARRIVQEDDRVDADHRSVIEGLLERMHADPGSIDRALELILVSKNIERIADHATNIAEDVIYLVEGEIIRHRIAARE